MSQPGVDAHGAKVQPVLGLEDEHLSADLQDGRRLHGRGHAEERQLRRHERPVLRHAVLPVHQLQSTAEVQCLEGREARNTWTQTQKSSLIVFGSNGLFGK